MNSLSVMKTCGGGSGVRLIWCYKESEVLTKAEWKQKSRLHTLFLVLKFFLLYIYQSVLCVCLFVKNLWLPECLYFLHRMDFSSLCCYAVILKLTTLSWFVLIAALFLHALCFCCFFQCTLMSMNFHGLITQHLPLWWLTNRASQSFLSITPELRSLLIL